MKKTTVYLTEDAALALRRLSITTGRPQAQLVREAVEGYVSKNAPKRVFLSAGSGSSGKPGGVFADEDEETILRRDVDREGGWR